MDVQTFIADYCEAFSGRAELPVAFWYSDMSEGELKRTEGCLFKAFPAVRAGEVVSMNAETVGCGGGRFYTGFAPMGGHIPDFVSLKERYKSSPGSVSEYIKKLNVPRSSGKYLHFARIDRIDTFDRIEGALFLATPDVLSGLCAWAFFDNDSPEAVVTLFGSGCSVAVTCTVNENRENGRRTFLGLFDPSVRPYVESGMLCLSVPMSRLREMLRTMRSTCLFDTHAWGKVRKRIAGEL